MTHYGQDKVQTTNSDGSENYSGKKIRWSQDLEGSSPSRSIRYLQYIELMVIIVGTVRCSHNDNL